MEGANRIYNLHLKIKPTDEEDDESMNKKIIGVGIVLLIAGILALATTLYQEKVEYEPDLEDYHMGVPTEKYEWRTRNMAVTSAGAILIVFGVALNLVGLKMK